MNATSRGWCMALGVFAALACNRGAREWPCTLTVECQPGWTCEDGTCRDGTAQLPDAGNLPSSSGGGATSVDTPSSRMGSSSASSSTASSTSTTSTSSTTCSSSCAQVGMNAVLGCVTGQCKVVSCSPPFFDGDGVASNGCETNLVDAGGVPCNAQTNATNCFLNHQIGGSCNSGRCLFSCDVGWADCSPYPAGCDTNIHEDANNCGGCGQPTCATGCDAGRCF